MRGRGSQSRSASVSNTASTYTEAQRRSDMLLLGITPMADADLERFAGFGPRGPVEHFYSDLEDNRVHHPGKRFRGDFTIGGRYARVVVHKRPWVAYSKPPWAYRGLPVGLQVPVGTMFESPFRVIRCLRRKIRREVIHARGHGGAKGKKGRYRRNEASNVWCR